MATVLAGDGASGSIRNTSRNTAPSALCSTQPVYHVVGRLRMKRPNLAPFVNGFEVLAHQHLKLDLSEVVFVVRVGGHCRYDRRGNDNFLADAGHLFYKLFRIYQMLYDFKSNDSVKLAQHEILVAIAKEFYSLP